MQYIRVQWRHDSADDPILLYSEIDNERWEMRKIEIFRDGSKGWSCTYDEEALTSLSLVPIPSLEEIRSDSQFKVCEISPEEFELVWNKRMVPEIT